MAKRPIVTEEQADLLRDLARIKNSPFNPNVEQGVWTPRSGWTHGTQANTVRILRALEKKGFTRNRHMSEYEITEVGRRLVEEMGQARG